MNRYTGTCLLFYLFFILRSTACAQCAACTTAVMTENLSNPISTFKTSGKTKAVQYVQYDGAHRTFAWGSFVRVIQYNTYGIGTPNQRLLNSRKPSEAGAFGEKFRENENAWTIRGNEISLYEIYNFAKMEKRNFRFKRGFRNQIKLSMPSSRSGLKEKNIGNHLDMWF